MSVSPLDLRREDFQKLEGDAIDRLLRALNTFGNQAATTLNGGGTIAGTLNASVQDVEIRTFPVTVQPKINGRPQLVWIGRAVKITNGKEEPVSLGGVAWTLNQQGFVEISAIDNVSTSEIYRVKLIVSAG